MCSFCLILRCLMGTFIEVGDVFLKNVYFSTDESSDEVLIAKPLS